MNKIKTSLIQRNKTSKGFFVIWCQSFNISVFHYFMFCRGVSAKRTCRSKTSRKFCVKFKSVEQRFFMFLKPFHHNLMSCHCRTLPFKGCTWFSMMFGTQQTWKILPSVSQYDMAKRTQPPPAISSLTGHHDAIIFSSTGLIRLVYILPLMQSRLVLKLCHVHVQRFLKQWNIYIYIYTPRR